MGVNFKRWQQKMLFYLTILSLLRFLSEDPPTVEENEQDKKKFMALDAWKQSNFFCQNYVLNGLANSLFNMFDAKKSARELWDSLEKKYKTKDVRLKKFVSKSSLSRSVLRKTIGRKGGSTSTVKANVVEHGQSSRVKKKPLTSKSSKLETRDGVSKRPIYKPQEPTYRFNEKCFNYGSNGHWAVDFRKKKKPYKKNPPQNKSRAHIDEMEDLSQDVDGMHLSAVVSEVNMVGSNLNEWWVDTEATRHIYAKKKMFTNFEPVSNREKLFMGNSMTSTIKVKGKAILKMTSGKELTLNDVLCTGHS
ncbi:uncharacterized protein LOC114318546 [Camellia sinensis]|uniref:uncharacterized protein LOC114318546 n=1 Tax=Camellia sinensis TaxID=4442 RepID=UPI001036EC34|nr:uncharacterized protein LOC114318546 [Camellia sinensis]